MLCFNNEEKALRRMSILTISWFLVLGAGATWNVPALNFSSDPWNSEPAVGTP